MSKAATSRDVARAEDYRRFQGYISQELEIKKRWNRYDPCSYLWMHELIDHPKFYSTIRYFLKELGVEQNSLTADNVSDILTQFDQERFVQRLLPNPLSPGSSCSVPSDKQLSSQDAVSSDDSESSSSSLPETANTIQVPVEVHVGINSASDSDHSIHDVGIRVPALCCRPHTALIQVMNLYSDRVLPVVIIAEEDTKTAFVSASVLPVRDFDYPFQLHSPVNISTNASLLRLGKDNFVLRSKIWKSENITDYGYSKYYPFDILEYDTETRQILTPEGNADNLLNHWLQGHHHIEMSDEGRLYFRPPSPAPSCSSQAGPSQTTFRVLRSRSVSMLRESEDPRTRKKRRKK